MRPASPNDSGLVFSRISVPLILVCSAVGVAFFLYTAFHPGSFLGWTGIIIALVVTLNFYAIKISVDQQTLLVMYGIGFIAREFDLHSIASFDMVENHSLHSIYNPTGNKLPCIRFRDGRSLTLPVTDARRLAEVLRRPRA